MPILPPLNDRECLGQVVDEARAFTQTEEARVLAEKLTSIDDLIRLIATLDFRADDGDPADGPRISCDVSQRLRLPTLDPNCLEATAFFMGMVPLIDPDLRVSMATLQLDEGLHTFPVIFRGDAAYPVILDPGSAPPLNVMAAALYDIRNASPATRENVAPWFVQVAWNVCQENGMDDVYEGAMVALRNALLTGEPIEDPEDVEYLLSLTESESQLFGNMGLKAHERVCRGIRNFGLALSKKQVRKSLDKVLSVARPIAGDALKMALIAEFGPIAAIALHDVDVDLMERKAYELQYGPIAEDEGQGEGQPKPKSTRKRKANKTPAERHRDMDRMALNFRNPQQLTQRSK